MHQKLRQLDRQLAAEFHLRVNVILPMDAETLQVRYTYNMDSLEDTDRALKLSIDDSVSGRCWRTRQPVVEDVERARRTAMETENAPKHYAHVRPTLKSLLCVPILSQSEETIGVLAFDSDLDFCERFAHEKILRLAYEMSSHLGDELIPGVKE